MKKSILALTIPLALMSSAYADSSAKTLSCQAPTASIMVSELRCTSPACAEQKAGNNQLAGLVQLAQLQSGTSSANLQGVNKGMSVMLANALKNSGCFNVQDKAHVSRMKEEFEAMGQVFQPKPVDYLITGDVTSIGLTTKRKSFGGGWIPIVGSVSSTNKQAELEMALRIVDVKTGEVIGSKKFGGENSDSNLGVTGGLFENDVAGYTGMGSIKGTPLESVVKNTLEQSAGFVIQRLSASE